jgi:hypothetical protein
MPKTIDEMTDEELEGKLYGNPRELINQIRAEERAAASVQTGTQNFWNRFYDRYPHLRDDHVMIDQVMRTNFDRLKNVHVDQAMDQIATLAEQHIEATVRRWNGSREHRVMVGGPAHGEPPRSAPAPQGSMGDLIRSRRQARREGGPFRADA